MLGLSSRRALLPSIATFQKLFKPAASGALRRWSERLPVGALIQTGHFEEPRQFRPLFGGQGGAQAPAQRRIVCQRLEKIMDRNSMRAAEQSGGEICQLCAVGLAMPRFARRQEC